MDPVSFWLIALGIPLTAVIGNSVIRLLIDLPQSAPADTVLAFVVFDAVAVMQAEEFKKFVAYSAFQEAFISIYVFLIVLGIVLLGNFCIFGRTPDRRLLSQPRGGFPFSSLLLCVVYSCRIDFRQRYSICI